MCQKIKLKTNNKQDKMTNVEFKNSFCLTKRNVLNQIKV